MADKLYELELHILRTFDAERRGDSRQLRMSNLYRAVVALTTWRVIAVSDARRHLLLAENDLVASILKGAAHVAIAMRRLAPYEPPARAS